MDKGIIVVIIFILGSIGGGVFLLQLSNDDVDETKFFAVDSPPPQPIVEEKEPDDAKGVARVEVPEGEEVLVDEEERIKQEEEAEQIREREAEDAARAADLEERNRIAREEAIEEARENAEREIREREEQEAAERENVRAKIVEGIQGRAREQSVCNSECLEKRERDAFVNACLDEWTPSCDTLVPQAKNSGFVVSNVELKITEFDLHDTLCVGLEFARARNIIGEPEVSCGYSDPSVVIMAGEYFMYVNRFDYIDKEDALLLYVSTDGLDWELKSDPLDATIFADVTMAMARVTKDGGVRIYYSIPEGNENEGWIASAYSVNGIDGWVFEGALLESIDEANISGPEVVELDDSSFAMYFAKDIVIGGGFQADIVLTEIGSAVSVDGKSWILNKDSSIVFSDDYEGMNKLIEGGDLIYGKALNPGIVRLDDGRWLMVYTASTIHQVCGNFNCNTFVPRVTDELWAATSEDGVVWEKIGSLGLRGSDATIVPLGNNQFRVYADDVDTAKGISTSEIENHWVGTFIITVE